MTGFQEFYAYDFGGGFYDSPIRALAYAKHSLLSVHKVSGVGEYNNGRFAPQDTVVVRGVYAGYFLTEHAERWYFDTCRLMQINPDYVNRFSDLLDDWRNAAISPAEVEKWTGQRFPYQGRDTRVGASMSAVEYILLYPEKVVLWSNKAPSPYTNADGVWGETRHALSLYYTENPSPGEHIDNIMRARKDDFTAALHTWLGITS